MERSGRHKGDTERALLTARVRLETLLDSEAEAREAEISESARTELREVAALIRSVELQVGQKRLGDMRSKHPSLDFLLQEGNLAEAHHHRDQLLQLYTDCDLVAAEGNRAISPRMTPMHVVPSTPGGSSRRLYRRGLSTEELDARVADMLTSEPAAKHLGQVGTLEFDAVSFAETVPHTIFVLFAWLEERLRLIKQVRDLGQVGNAANFHARLMHFMEKVNSLYKDTNPFHNSTHAADVVSTLEWFFRSEYLQARASSLDHLITLIGGAIHDVGHPGQANNFQQKTLSMYAIRYNDKSILENMHVSLSFEIMHGDLACNWFSLLPTDYRHAGAPSEDSAPAVNLQQYVRKALVQMVLATDMMRHAKAVQDLKNFVEEQEALTTEVDETGQKHEQKQVALEKKLLTLDTILHAADISNAARPRGVMLKWTQRVLMEFWAQGDEEKRLGLAISPLCDRETEQWAVPKGQLGFTNYVVMPLYTPLSQLIPEVREGLDNLRSNVAFWEELDSKQASHDQIFSAL